MSFNILKKIELCCAAELPEKAGVDELELLAIEDRKFASEADALAFCVQIEDAPRFILIQAMVPKLPAETVKAIEKFRASLPAMKEKLNALLQIDPETGEPTWRQKIEEKIIARVKGKVCATTPCEACGSRIATAHITKLACPVCGASYMETKTDLELIAGKESAIAELRDTIEAADAKIAKMEQDAIEASDEFKRMWLVVENLSVENLEPIQELQEETLAEESVLAEA